MTELYQPSQSKARPFQPMKPPTTSRQGKYLRYSDLDAIGRLTDKAEHGTMDASERADLKSLILTVNHTLKALRYAHVQMLEMGRWIRDHDEENTALEYWTQDGDYIIGDDVIRAILRKSNPSTQSNETNQNLP